MVGGQFFLQDFEIQLSPVSNGLSDVRSFMCSVPTLEINLNSLTHY